MRSYHQHCPIAHALDAVGDRWSLLVVRELLVRDCRYTDLRNGLPGVATNLLAERLRALEDAGVVERVAAPPPVATTLYRLTPRGRELAPVLNALGGWGARDLPDAPGPDAVRTRWAALFLAGVAAARRPTAPLVVELAGPDETVSVTMGDGRAAASGGPAPAPDVRLEGGPADLLAFVRSGAPGAVRVSGPRAAERRLRALVTPR